MVEFLDFLRNGGGWSGRIGFGRGKAREVPVAIQKAMENARKNMTAVSLDGGTLQYSLIGEHGAARSICTSFCWYGYYRGGAMRAVFEVVGVTDVLAKCIGTTIPLM